MGAGDAKGWGVGRGEQKSSRKGEGAYPQLVHRSFVCTTAEEAVALPGLVTARSAVAVSTASAKDILSRLEVEDESWSLFGRDVQCEHSIRFVFQSPQPGHRSLTWLVVLSLLLKFFTAKDAVAAFFAATCQRLGCELQKLHVPAIHSPHPGQRDFGCSALIDGDFWASTTMAPSG